MSLKKLVTRFVAVLKSGIMVFAISLFSLGCLSGLNGCTSIKKTSFIVDRDTHYLSAKSIPPLKIPPQLSSHTIHSHYPVSERNYLEQSKSVSVIPPGLNEKD